MGESMRDDFGVLADVARKNKEYLNNELDPDGRETINMAWSIINTLRGNLPEICGGFGLGFPFHSVKQSGELVVNPEFLKYSNNFINKVERARSIGHTAWKCFTCQHNKWFDPVNCKACDEVDIKPRDVMKVMPDIDVFLITNNVTTDLLNQIQTIAQQNSFHQSDISSRETVTRIEQTFDSMGKNNNELKFPADMHVIQRDDFILAMDQISNGCVDLDVDIYSLHYDWVLNKEIDFGFDIIFSSTFNPGSCDQNLIDCANKAKKGLVLNYSVNDILDIARLKSKRANVLLEHEPTRRIFIDRVKSWNNL
jgi:hypothetical protein